jgi:methylglyoxal synthase
LDIEEDAPEDMTTIQPMDLDLIEAPDPATVVQSNDEVEPDQTEDLTEAATVVQPSDGFDDPTQIPQDLSSSAEPRTETIEPETAPMATDSLEAADETPADEVDLIVNQLFDDEPPTATGAIAGASVSLAELSSPSTVSAGVLSSTPPESGDPKVLSDIHEKYIVLLAHEAQEVDLIELVERYQPFLTRCQTLTTPALSETLKDQIDFTVSEQTPDLLQGGYQSVNRLITSGKILAVLFARDFLTPQATQSNDDALSRSCNVYGVLFASNLPTAEAIIHSLKTRVASVAAVSA